MEDSPGKIANLVGRWEQRSSSAGGSTKTSLFRAASSEVQQLTPQADCEDVSDVSEEEEVERMNKQAVSGHSSETGSGLYSVNSQRLAQAGLSPRAAREEANDGLGSGFHGLDEGPDLLDLDEAEAMLASDHSGSAAGQGLRPEPATLQREEIVFYEEEAEEEEGSGSGLSAELSSADQFVPAGGFERPSYNRNLGVGDEEYDISEEEEEEGSRVAGDEGSEGTPNVGMSEHWRAMETKEVAEGADLAAAAAFADEEFDVDDIEDEDGLGDGRGDERYDGGRLLTNTAQLDGDAQSSGGLMNLGNEEEFGGSGRHGAARTGDGDDSVDGVLDTSLQQERALPVQNLAALLDMADSDDSPSLTPIRKEAAAESPLFRTFSQGIANTGLSRIEASLLPEGAAAAGLPHSPPAAPPAEPYQHSQDADLSDDSVSINSQEAESFLGRNSFVASRGEVEGSPPMEVNPNSQPFVDAQPSAVEVSAAEEGGEAGGEKDGEGGWGQEARIKANEPAVEVAEDLQDGPVDEKEEEEEEEEKKQEQEQQKEEEEEHVHKEGEEDQQEEAKLLQEADGEAESPLGAGPFASVGTELDDLPGMEPAGSGDLPYDQQPLDVSTSVEASQHSNSADPKCDPELEAESQLRPPPPGQEEERGELSPPQLPPPQDSASSVAAKGNGGEKLPAALMQQPATAGGNAPPTFVSSGGLGGGTAGRWSSSKLAPAGGDDGTGIYEEFHDDPGINCDDGDSDATPCDGPVSPNEKTVARIEEWWAGSDSIPAEPVLEDEGGSKEDALLAPPPGWRPQPPTEYEDVLQTILKDFTVAVLQQQPQDIVAFARSYFEEAHSTGGSGSVAGKAASLRR
mmetsp:Transcript_20213/g.56056  ORF Transcript_20213/g.56056 Transcript_20213/m.56056 type:complete len:854 (-) Transcript_20213:118-2679(-)